MEITEQFIRDFVISTTKDLEVEQKELNLKLDLLASNMASNFSTLENILRSNFPNLCMYGFSSNHTSSMKQIGMDDVTKSELILNGEDYVSRSFKRHIEFLKLNIDNPSIKEKFDKIIDEYFHYWNESYFQEKYKPPLISAEALTTKPNPIESLYFFSYVISNSKKKLLNIESSEKDIWKNNKPITYKYDHDINMFYIETSAGHKCCCNSTIVKNIPDLDENICAAIIREYKEKFNIDYIKYVESEVEFHNFIIKLINYLIFTHENLYNKIKNEYSQGSVDLCYNDPCDLYVTSDKIIIKFKFKDLDNTNYRYLEIKIENTIYKQMDISVKFSNSYQSAQYKVDKQAEEKDQLITFCGYYKQNGNDGPHLYFAKEDWKLSILYYGKQLIETQDSIFEQIEKTIEKRQIELTEK